MSTNFSRRRSNLSDLKLLVVGAGVVGGSIAYRLAAGGADVTIIDPGPAGNGTTSRSFAWLNGNDKQPAAYGLLNAEGIAAHRRLAADLGHSRWLHLVGNVMFVADPAALEARVARLRALKYPAELITPARARELEPNVDFSTAKAMAWFPEEGWAHGWTLASALSIAAQGCNARLLTAAVTAVRVGTAGVSIEAGHHRLDADAVVLAAGRFTDQLAALAGVHVPLTPTSGLLAVTTPVARSPSRVVYAPDIHFRPDLDGRVVLQDEVGDRSVAADSPEDPRVLPMCQVLLARARRYVPALRDAHIESARVGTRALPADGHPIVGRVSFARGVYVAVTHSGMTLGPLLGELVARDLMGDAAPVELLPYRTDRCVTPL